MSLETWVYAPNVSPDDLPDNGYMELKDSGKEQYSPGAATANRTFMTNWDVRPDFLDSCLGYAFQAGTGISRVLPDEHPEIDNFFAEDATVEGLGVLGASDNDSISWTNAKINVNYKPRDYAVLEDAVVSSELQRYTTRTYEFNADYLTLNGTMTFVSSQRQLASPPGKITTSMGLVYVWHEVPALATKPFTIPNLTAITNCIGRINSVPFDVSGGNYPAGTVLFIGVDPKMVTGKLAGDTATTPLGNYYWEITFKFLYRYNGAGLGTDKAGHNYLFDLTANPPNGKWDLVTSDGTTGGTRIYQTADLNTLWTLG